MPQESTCRPSLSGEGRGGVWSLTAAWMFQTQTHVIDVEKGEEKETELGEEKNK